MLTLLMCGCASCLAEGVHESEGDYAKVVSLAPAEVVVGSGDIAVTQVVCGVHHTVALLQNGDVYTFGNNSYGQLGLDNSTPMWVRLWRGCVCGMDVCVAWMCVWRGCVCGVDVCVAWMCVWHGCVCGVDVCVAWMCVAWAVICCHVHLWQPPQWGTAD